MKRLLLVMFALALVLPGCENPAGDGASPVEDPEYITIEPGSLGDYDTIYVGKNATLDYVTRTLAVTAIKTAIRTKGALLKEGVNITVPYVPSDAADYPDYSIPDDRLSTTKTLTVSLNANPGYIFDPAAAYTFGGRAAVDKTPGALSFDVPYTIVDGRTGCVLDLENLTLGNRAITLTGTTGAVTVPYPGSGVSLSFNPLPAIASGATVAAVADTDGTTAAASIGTLSNPFNFSGANKYLNIKVTPSDGSTNATVYRIAVTVEPLPKPSIDPSNSAYIDNTNNVILFNGGQSGDTAAAAIEGVVRITGSSASGLYNAAPATVAGITTVSRYITNNGTIPADSEFDDISSATADLDFTNATTLWIRHQYTSGGEVLSSRYYKVRVIINSN